MAASVATAAHEALPRHLNGVKIERMEKPWPAYDLDAVKQVLGSAHTLAITTSALRVATGPLLRPARHRGHGLELRAEDVCDVDDKFRWHLSLQDADHISASDLAIYVKVEADVITEFRIMSFKES